MDSRDDKTGIRRTYSDAERLRLKTIPITSVLASGLLGEFEMGSTPSGMFLSPFREERSPSFHINSATNEWCDFGQSGAGGRHEGGDVIKLVMLLGRKSYAEALDFLAAFDPGKVSYAPHILAGYENARGSAASMKVTFAGDFTDPSIIGYLTDRRAISVDVANIYCRQIRIEITMSDGHSFSVKEIGFENVAGGYVSRSTSDKYPKKNIGEANVSVIGSDGKAYVCPDRTLVHSDCLRDARRTKDMLCVFEGFMDMLSWMELLDRKTPGDCDLLVLNSCSNLNMAADFICGYGSVVSYLDNDVSGRECTARIRGIVEGAGHRFSDRSLSFADCEGVRCKDVNEWLVRATENLRRKRESSRMEARKSMSSPGKGKDVSVKIK